MGNCQAAEAATVVIQHPDNKIERIYTSVSANQIMINNPGHYVALVVSSPTADSGNGTPVKQLKLLRPDDKLLIGQVYGLVSFEDVLNEFAGKKSVKLGKLLERGGVGPEKKKVACGPKLSLNRNRRPESSPSVQMDNRVENSSRISRAVVRHHFNGGQWKPVLHSIAEIGT